MIYVPDSNIYNRCYVIQNEDTIRAYNVVPNYNTNYLYRDYYIHSDYIYRDGQGQWNQYSTLPICLDSSVITHEEFYRQDYYKSLIIFVIFFIFIIYIPIKIIFRFFKKRRD